MPRPLCAPLTETIVVVNCELKVGDFEVSMTANRFIVFHRLSTSYLVRFLPRPSISELS